MRSINVPMLSTIAVMLFWSIGTQSTAVDDPGSVPAFVGRINTAGYKNRNSCTGFRVQGGHILTARHCIPRLKEDAVHFVRGYHQGTYIDLQTALSKNFTLASTDDLAILCGADPLKPGLAVAALSPSSGQEFTVLGYGSPRVHKLTVSSCHFLGWENASNFYLNCPLPPGTSGGPVAIQVANQWKIVGVVSASNKTLSRAVWINPKTIHALCPDQN